MATLVTGGAGFIGSHVVEQLFGRGEEVVVLDDFNAFYEPSWKWRNVSGLEGRPGFHLIQGDIRDRVAVADAFAAAPIRKVIHLAARAGVQPSLRDPALYADVNVTGTANLLEGARRADVEVVVAASSSSVYGADRGTPFREGEAADHPVSPYAATKRANELQCWTFHHLTGIPVTCLRFFTAYGPRNRPDMAIYKFATAIREDGEIRLFGDGTVQRDFTFVGDVAAGVVAAWSRPAGYLLCNLGRGEPVPVEGLVAELERALGRAARIRRAPLPPGHVPVTWAAVDRAREVFGWEPSTTLAEGVERFAAWFRSTSTGDRVVA